MVVKAKIKPKGQIVIEAAMAEVTACRAEIPQLKKMLEKLQAMNDRSIAGFCARQEFSVAHFYNLTKEKKGPRIRDAGHRKIITPGHEADWQDNLPVAQATNGSEQSEEIAAI
jgi:hypothetical protein